MSNQLLIMVIIESFTPSSSTTTRFLCGCRDDFLSSSLYDGLGKRMKCLMGSARHLSRSSSRRRKVIPIEGDGGRKKSFR